MERGKYTIHFENSLKNANLHILCHRLGIGDYVCKYQCLCLFVSSHFELLASIFHYPSCSFRVRGYGSFPISICYNINRT